MAATCGPTILDKGLLLSLDTGNPKSFPGEPTTNLFTDPTFSATDTVTIWNTAKGYSNTILPAVMTEDGKKFIRLQTDNLSTNGKSSEFQQFPYLTMGQTYTVSYYARLQNANKDDVSYMGLYYSPYFYEPAGLTIVADGTNVVTVTVENGLDYNRIKAPTTGATNYNYALNDVNWTMRGRVTGVDSTDKKLTLDRVVTAGTYAGCTLRHRSYTYHTPAKLVQNNDTWTKEQFTFIWGDSDWAQANEFGAYRGYGFVSFRIYTTGSVFLDVYQPQLENKGHATPFVNGTRSAVDAWKDLSGNGNHCTLANAKFDSNGMIYYNRSNSYVESKDFKSGNSLTIEMVVNPEINNDGQCFIGKHNAGGTQSILTGFWTGGYNTELSGVSTIQGTKTTGNQHLVYTFENVGSDVRAALYKNNVPIFTSYTFTGKQLDYSTGGKPWVIGQDWDSSTAATDFLQGYLPVIRIYNRVLSQAEISNNFNNLKGRFGL